MRLTVRIVVAAALVAAAGAAAAPPPVTPPAAGACAQLTLMERSNGTGQFAVSLKGVEKLGNYQYKCLWLTPAGAEAFVVFIGVVPIGVPGELPSGDCARTNPSLYESDRRYLDVSGGERMFDTRAVGGNERVLRETLAKAEAASVGAPCTAKPTTSTTSSPSRLVDIQTLPEYRAFYGIGDEGMGGLALDRACKAVVDRVDDYPNAHGRIVIPGERSVGPHSARLTDSTTDIYKLLALSVKPSVLRAQGNVYALVTRPFEALLRRRIEAQKRKLLPADVVELALEIAGGSYPLAVLTVNNLFKEVTYAGRDAGTKALGDYQRASRTPEQRAAYLKRLPGYRAVLQRESKLVARLASLRADPAGVKDKMGPWYHAFTILTAGAIVGPVYAPGVVVAEHGGKLFNWFKSLGEGGFNAEKAVSDACFANAAVSRQLRRVSR